MQKERIRETKKPIQVNRAPLRDILRAFHTHPQEKMVKQVNITAYAVPKQSLPETPKRKRIVELVNAGQIEVISPSQASPEHKAGRKASPRLEAREMVLRFCYGF